MKRPRAALAAILFAALPAAAQTETAVAGRGQAVDGDTLTVSGRLIDLAAIQAPEVDRNCPRAGGSTWRCGQNAAFALANIVGRHWVHCRVGLGDPSRPVPGYCTLAGPGGPDVNAAMLRQGWARTTPAAPDHYRAIEGAARRARLGIWGDGKEVLGR